MKTKVLNIHFVTQTTVRNHFLNPLRLNDAQISHKNLRSHHQLGKNYVTWWHSFLVDIFALAASDT